MLKIVAPISYLWLSSAALVACVAAPPPYEEYTLARTAIVAAKDVDSAKNAPGLWIRAEESYRMAQREFNENDFAQARRHFKSAIRFSEKAENATKLRKFQSGDGAP